MNRPLLPAFAGVALTLGLLVFPSTAQAGREIPTAGGLVAALNGTTWCAPNSHTRVAVDRLGTVATKTGKEMCLVFKAVGGQLVTQIIWWNLQAGIHVHEWAIATPIGSGRLSYVEAEQPAGANFQGIEGLGELSLGGDGMLEMHQIGHLADGSAAAFNTKLARVKALPRIALGRTYPAP